MRNLTPYDILARPSSWRHHEKRAYLANENVIQEMAENGYAHDYSARELKHRATVLKVKRNERRPSDLGRARVSDA